MPVEAKPLFRPDVLRPHLMAFQLPAHVPGCRPKLKHWADLISSGRADSFKEREILPDFLTDFFCGLLAYTRPADGGERYTISRERLVEVNGKFADAVLGDFGDGKAQFVVALEGKGPKDPLDRPFAGRRVSAVDQGYHYAINLPCDWIIVTSIRQTRRYFKGADQYTYERFDTEKLATDDNLLKKFIFLLAAERVVPLVGRCHLYGLQAASDKAGHELTKQFYIQYANMRQDAFTRLRNRTRIRRPTMFYVQPRSYWTVFSSAPFVRSVVFCLPTPSPRHTNTVIHIALVPSGTTFKDCSTRSTTGMPL